MVASQIFPSFDFFLMDVPFQRRLDGYPPVADNQSHWS
jgi:hypothetical protein